MITDGIVEAALPVPKPDAPVPQSNVSALSSSGTKIHLSWPKWFWCFPDCVIGETCFLRVYRFCRSHLPDAIVLNCILVALDWCDIMNPNPVPI
ncbi:hypothetical protein AXF42_Ash010849 [Apostasia shenzhenica]|uniref:Uncharacterized protein n=1 Tax=Apostasia shenzhenica TaxID=1088818 RepID=A0A2I0A0V2_9ASPA|nr:hypothetical protein AXF42_Ash010849 [Apostasia shenzhenica]